MIKYKRAGWRNSHEVGDVLVDVVVEEVADCMGVDEFHVCTGARGLFVEAMKEPIYYIFQAEKAFDKLNLLQLLRVTT